jgi:2,3,4,5-tetrahydropyridine-2,6-dicarboxylate N-acetyltransferase
MDAYEIIKYISDAEKKTPVKVYVKGGDDVEFLGSKVFGAGDRVVIGEWSEISPVLSQHASDFEDVYIENVSRNSAIPLLDLKGINARIEPGAIIRDQVSVGDGAVIMMGAIINIGAVVGDRSMIDMGAVLGGRAQVGKDCHIGAGAVLAGVIEPPSKSPVIIEDDVLVGANAVVLEGVKVGRGSVVAAGAVVISDVAPGMVVAGIPAKKIGESKDTDGEKIAIVDTLRKL